MVDQECELFSWDPPKDPVALVYSYHKEQAQTFNQARGQVRELVFPCNEIYMCICAWTTFRKIKNSCIQNELCFF